MNEQDALRWRTLREAIGDEALAEFIDPVAYKFQVGFPIIGSGDPGQLIDAIAQRLAKTVVR